MKHEHATPQHDAYATKDTPMPPVPLSLDGWQVLHQMFRLRWPAWKALSAPARQEAATEVVTLFHEWERSEAGQSGLFSMLGHKGDVLILHFRRSLDELNDAELKLTHTKLAEFLEPTLSYLSIVEFGLYESSVRLYAALKE